MTPHLHIVSFNVPYPADYGGVIDVFYRIKALHFLGVKIHLHCFEYGRNHASELERYCVEVLYYKRSMSPWLMFSSRPFIVESRSNKALVNRLMQDDYPVLLEGLHCCSTLEALRREESVRKSHKRRIFVRMHNVEHDYYNELSRVEKNILRRFYLKLESSKLRSYENVLAQATALLVVTEQDLSHFRLCDYTKALLLPSSHENEDVVSHESSPDSSSFALYHGDLSVAENVEAAEWIIKNLFADGQHRLVIAGRNPVKSLISLVKAYPNIELVPSPIPDRMRQLIAQAQVIVMVTFQPTGLKLKLLNSLYAGRFCLVNSNMVSGTPLATVCTVSNSAADMRQKLDNLMLMPFTENDKLKRRDVLGQLYDNNHNAEVLVDLLL